MTLNVIGWCACARILNFPTANVCADVPGCRQGPWEEREPLICSSWHRQGSMAGARRPREGSRSQGRKGGRKMLGPGRAGDAQGGGAGAWLGAEENSVLFQKAPTRVPARKTGNPQVVGIGVLEPISGGGMDGVGKGPSPALQKGRVCSPGGEARLHRSAHAHQLCPHAVSRHVVLVRCMSGRTEVFKSGTSGTCPLSSSVRAQPEAPSGEGIWAGRSFWS